MPPALPRRPARTRPGSPARTRPGSPARSARLRAGALLLALLPPLLFGLSFPRPVAADARPRGVWPLQPRPAVAARFDPPDSLWGAGHRGVDLVGHPVSVVHSALPGTVRFAGVIAGRGVVVVGHGATRTTYEPVRTTVSVGDEVAAGQPIGLLEVGGSHCFPTACLHWGWLRGETYLDPLLLVGAVPIRLLPPGGAAVLGGPALGVPRLGSRSPGDDPALSGAPPRRGSAFLGPTISSATGPARTSLAATGLTAGATAGARLATGP